MCVTEELCELGWCCGVVKGPWSCRVAWGTVGRGTRLRPNPGTVGLGWRAIYGRTGEMYLLNVGWSFGMRLGSYEMEPWKFGMVLE